MKRSLVILAAGIIAVAAAGSTIAALSSSAPAGKPKQMALYGHVTSIAPHGRRLELRFDPALWLTGVAAERACNCGPGRVANDYFIVDETHRLLTFVVRRDATVTIVTAHDYAVPITVRELAQIVAGKNPKHRDLLEPKAGFWIRIGAKYPNPIVALGQQYQP
ncbi:MAG TPA: hypothetical protein VEG40_01735 [Gaiellaceae bacterium]|nr:hypothetical protein [Gaiellaceae bacterium]